MLMSTLGTASQQRLSKILALAANDDENNAIAAFLLARGMMAKHALPFASLMRPADEVTIELCEKSYERLAKLLSLTSSDKEGEAIAAFLMARRLMQRMGITFEIILKLPRCTSVEPYAKAYPTAEMENVALRKRLRKLQGELAEANAKIKRYEKAFGDMVNNAWAGHFEPGAQAPAQLN